MGRALKPTNNSWRQWIAEEYEDEELLLLDGFDDAILGVAEGCSRRPLVIYDRRRCIEILVKQGATFEEAEEHFEFNVAGSYVGENTPLFLVRP